MNTFQVFIAFIGRVCLSLIFLLSAINEMMHWQVSEQYFLSSFSQWMNYYQANPVVTSVLTNLLPWLPIIMLVGLAFKVIGALLIIIGWKVRFGAFLLILFLVPASLLIHHFWGMTEDEKPIEVIMFLKNLSIFGGLLVLLAFGKGPKKKASSSTEKG